MEIELTNEKENPLLKRQEVYFRLKHDDEEREGASPSREEARSVLIKKLRCSPKHLVIDTMRTEFGKRETVGYAKVYEREDRLRKVEREHIIQRNFSSAAGEEREEGG